MISLIFLVPPFSFVIFLTVLLDTPKSFSSFEKRAICPALSLACFGLTLEIDEIFLSENGFLIPVNKVILFIFSSKELFLFLSVNNSLVEVIAASSCS